MSTDKLYYLFKKSEKIRLSKHFNSQEFNCNCSDKNHENRISKELIDKLELVRIEIGEPIKVTSGYRTSEHNKKIGGSLKSQHILGNAADIKCSNLDKLYKVCEKHFKAVGDGRKKGFIHVDTRQDKTRRWDY